MSTTEASSAERGLTKVIEGLVTSNKMDRTITVQVSTKIRHPRYKKYVTRSKKYHADDPQNTCQIGDRVRIVETRPLSKLKRWRLQEVVERAE